MVLVFLAIPVCFGFVVAVDTDNVLGLYRVHL